MGFINLGRLNIRKRNSCASALISLSDVQPPSVYKSHILNGPINKLIYIFYSARRMLLGRTPNLADPLSKTQVKANAGMLYIVESSFHDLILAVV